MTRARLWLHDQRLHLIAKYRTWRMFRAQPWREHPAKRRTP